MNTALFLMGTVIVICVLTHKFTSHLKVPSLLFFIGLGMCFGENGIFRISFDDYALSEMICSACLIFVMFYGGFGTNIKEAKPVAVQSFLLSTLGVVLTAGMVGVFVHVALGAGWLESMLIGSVVSSTDAASVFNILRSKKLNLKDNTASLLELESGSNDPMSYMLTVVMVSLLSGQEISVGMLLLKQIAIGVLCGLVLGKVTVWLLNNLSIELEQGETILVFAVATLAYTLPGLLGGNGYLSVYLCGILMGNSYLPGKRDLVHFFDVVTGVCQMMIFFLLGLLVTPAKLPQVILPSLLIMLFMTLIARPISVLGILLPFKARLGQIGLVSWAGLRGVASIVFAIFAVMQGVSAQYNLFNLVFCIVLFSLSVQGALLPWMSKKMRMIDEKADVLKTFTDYKEVNDVSFVKISVQEDHRWCRKRLWEIALPNDLLVVLIMRGEEKITPNGDTQILPGDLLVIAAREFEDRENLTLREITVENNDRLKGRTLSEINLTQKGLIVMIERGKQTIIPNGNTRIEEGDLLVVAKF